MVRQDLLHDDSVRFPWEKLVQVNVPVMMRGALGQSNNTQTISSLEVKLPSWVLGHLEPLLNGVPEDEEPPGRQDVGDQQMFTKARSPGILEGNSKLGEHSMTSSKGSGSGILTEHGISSVNIMVMMTGEQHKELAENILIFIVDYSAVV